MNKKFLVKKHLGQNFLINKGIISKIIKTAQLSAGDIVLEIGPGTGALTFELARVCEKVIAVEKDRDLALLLKEKLSAEHITNVEIVTADILTFLKSFKLQATSYSVVANIPYYLTSVLIRTLLEQKHKPENIFLTIQKEVAQRICALDGKESLLSLSVKFYADPKIYFYISRGSFSPPPKVESAFIEITPKTSPPLIAPEKFFTVIKAGFSAPRKKLIGNLAANLPNTDKKTVTEIFTRLKLDQNTRPEHLSLSQWILLTQCLKS